MIFGNHHILTKMLIVFIGTHDSELVCRRYLSSSSSESVLIKHKQRCEQQEETAIKTSNKP